MINLQTNTVKMKYALLKEKRPIYVKDYEGNVEYEHIGDKYEPIETGRYEYIYDEPIDFYASISMSGGEVQAVEFGIDMSQYDAVMICPINYIPISETSLIWLNSEVLTKDSETLAESIIDPISADYEVTRLSPSINTMRYLLKRVIK